MAAVKPMRSAVNQVQLRVRIRFRRLFRIIRLDDAVRRAVDRQHLMALEDYYTERSQINDSSAGTTAKDK